MRYEAPKTIKEATGLLAKAKGNAFVLAGGSDLLVRLKNGMIEPELVVDIKRIPSMQTVTKTASGFRIGGAVPCAALGENAALMKAWPGVVEAARLIGSDQIQGRCTIVGNLCNASPAADSVPAMVAAGAKAAVVGPKGKRTIAVEDVVTSPGKTSLKKGEVIEAITLPKPAPKTGRRLSALHTAHRNGHRRSERRRLSDAGCEGCGQESPRCARCCRADRAAGARGREGDRWHELDDAALAKLAAACEAACKPIDDKRGTIEFRTDVAGVLARRAAGIAYQRAGGQ